MGIFRDWIYPHRVGHSDDSSHGVREYLNLFVEVPTMLDVACLFLASTALNVVAIRAAEAFVAPKRLADSGRVLVGGVEHTSKIMQQTGQSGQEGLQNFTQATRITSRRIGQILKKRTEQAKATGLQAYRELVEMSRQTVTQGQQTLEQLEEQTDKPAQCLVKTLQIFIPRAQQVIQQTDRRVFQGEAVPAQDKLVSIFEPHMDIIKREKDRKPVEYGHNVWLNEVDGGIVSHYRVFVGNPHDTQQ